MNGWPSGRPERRSARNGPPLIPLVLKCDRCGDWQLEHIGWESETTVFHEVSTPCRRCPGTKRTAPDMRFYSERTPSGRLVPVLQQMSDEEARDLFERLVEAAQAEDPEVAIEKALRGLGALGEALLDVMNRWGGLASVVGLILTILLQVTAGDSLTPEEVNRIVKDAVAEHGVDDSPPVDPRTPRNAQCPCGSSTKYKKCHGRPDSMRDAGRPQRGP